MMIVFIIVLLISFAMSVLKQVCVVRSQEHSLSNYDKGHSMSRGPMNVDFAVLFLILISNVSALQNHQVVF